MSWAVAYMYATLRHPMSGDNAFVMQGVRQAFPTPRQKLPKNRRHSINRIIFISLHRYILPYTIGTTFYVVVEGNTLGLD